MKKLICILLLTVFALNLPVAAFAESVPSKTTDDLIKFEVDAEKLPVGSDFYIRPVHNDEVEYQENIDICQAEIEKLLSGQNIKSYFSEAVDSKGDEIRLSEILGAGVLNIFEFCPVIAGGYKEEYGTVTVEMLFPTPYEKNEKVAVMIGIVTDDEDDVQTVKWTGYEGIGVESSDEEQLGSIEVEFDSEIVIAIQEGIALLAVVSC